jgi:hypothetical protein
MCKPVLTWVSQEVWPLGQSIVCAQLLGQMPLEVML